MSWPVIGRIKRITYVIDGTGVVRDVFAHQLRASLHVADANAAAKELSAAKRQ